MHMYEFANGFAPEDCRNVTFLRADRRDDGTRTYRLFKGEPLATGFGEDLYQNIFKSSSAAPSST